MTVIPGEEQAVRGGGSTRPASAGPTDLPYRHNPGTKVVLTRDKKYTAPGVLVDGNGQSQPFVFPAPPLDTLQRSLTYNWGDYDTIADGQFSRPSSMQLQSLQFDTIIVGDDYPWAFYNPLRTFGQTPDDMVKELGQVLRAGTPFMLDIYDVKYKPDTGLGGIQTVRDGSGGVSEQTQVQTGVGYSFGPVPVLHMRATLRTLTSESRSGEPDALYITVGFFEHRIPGAAQTKLGGGTRGGADSSNLPVTLPLAVLHQAYEQRIAAGKSSPTHSLQDLAVLYYGSASKWQIIKKANSWLGNTQATHDLGDWNTAELKAAGKAGRKLAIPTLPS